jgi:L-malate glycosyltransferase
MKILFISTMAASPWGGSEELWLKSATYALEQGHEVIASVYDWGQLHPKLLEFKAKGGKVQKRQRVFYGHSLVRRAFGKIIKIISAPRQIKALAKLAPDVVFISQGTVYECMFPEFLELMETVKARFFIITQANTEYETVPPQCFFIGRDIFKKAEKLYFVSNRNKLVAERQMAKHLDNAKVISNPPSFSSTEPVEWPKGEMLNMAFTGRLNSTVKGLGVLFETLSNESWRMRDWALNVYGKGGDEKYLKELINLYQLQEKVALHGHVEDIKKVWAQNHVLLMASTLEGTPLALIEAMLCGRPAVVSDVGGNAELIEEGKNGFVAEAPSPSSFGKALERLWQNRDNLKLLGSNAREAALSLELDSYKKIIEAL